MKEHFFSQRKETNSKLAFFAFDRSYALSLLWFTKIPASIFLVVKIHEPQKQASTETCFCPISSVESTKGKRFLWIKTSCGRRLLQLPVGLANRKSRFPPPPPPAAPAGVWLPASTPRLPAPQASSLNRAGVPRVGEVGWHFPPPRKTLQETSLPQSMRSAGEIAKFGFSPQRCSGLASLPRQALAARGSQCPGGFCKYRKEGGKRQRLQPEKAERSSSFLKFTYGLWSISSVEFFSPCDIQPLGHFKQ